MLYFLDLETSSNNKWTRQESYLRPSVFRFYSNWATFWLLLSEQL
jgi:hypothetical protein